MSYPGALDSARELQKDLAELLQKACETNTPLRSAAIVFDWREDHDTRGEFPLGIWMDADGAVIPSNKAALYGTIQKMLQFLALQTDALAVQASMLQQTYDRLEREIELMKDTDGPKEHPGKAFAEAKSAFAERYQEKTQRRAAAAAISEEQQTDSQPASTDQSGGRDNSPNAT